MAGNGGIEIDQRPVFGRTEAMQADPLWRDHLLFDEYLHGDNGVGIGASYQTGWTAMVANLIERPAFTSSPREQSQIAGEGRAD